MAKFVHCLQKSVTFPSPMEPLVSTYHNPSVGLNHVTLIDKGVYQIDNISKFPCITFTFINGSITRWLFSDEGKRDRNFNNLFN